MSYAVQWRTDMETWNDVAVGEANEWIDVNGSLAAGRYYRVREE